MRALILLMLLATACPAWAAPPLVSGAGSLRLDDTSFRLDGIDAPDADQTCLDPEGKLWTCGVEARDRLKAHIANRAVRCEDKGPDPAYKLRKLGVCTIEGEAQTLNEWLVREGWAINDMTDARRRFATEEANARESRRGLWRGCFAEPRDLRRWNLNAAKLLGAGCRPNRENRTRATLFSVDPAMPPECPIKAKLALRAQVVGYTGIYHTPECRSYRGLKRIQRWFCSEDDARAEGFRKALTCP